uniref:Ribosomal protein S7 n=1 Tax=Prototheca zopfii TaxID=3112 RepID=A0A2P1G7Q5_9CHLO|nr:ribosomal protein S7 [Prototheca bovis]AVM80989.1 ribosomal protein S7 [Prototheca bovis]
MNKILSNKKRHIKLNLSKKINNSIYRTNTTTIYKELNNLYKNNKKTYKNFIKTRKNNLKFKTFFLSTYIKTFNNKISKDSKNYNEILLLKYRYKNYYKTKKLKTYKKIKKFFINQIMKEGKKIKALKIFNLMLEYIKIEKIQNPYTILMKAITNIIPKTYSKRKRTKNKFFNQIKKSIQWIFKETKKIKSSNPFYIKLSNEIFKAYKKKGTPYNKKIENQFKSLKRKNKK